MCAKMYLYEPYKYLSHDKRLYIGENQQTVLLLLSIFNPLRAWFKET